MMNEVEDELEVQQAEQDIVNRVPELKQLSADIDKATTAAINQAELFSVTLMPFLRVLQKMGFETLGDVNRLIEEHSDDAYQLATAQLGVTDLDILSENIGIQNLCYVYVLKQGSGLAGLCQLLDWMNGDNPDNAILAQNLLKQAEMLKFMDQ